MADPNDRDADILVSSARARPRIPWIETQEARPDINERVLFATEGGLISTGYRGELGLWYGSGGETIKSPVRWWSPLPLVPQTEVRR